MFIFAGRCPYSTTSDVTFELHVINSGFYLRFPAVYGVLLAAQPPTTPLQVFNVVKVFIHANLNVPQLTYVALFEEE
jgi:hypothetical protein